MPAGVPVSIRGQHNERHPAKEPHPRHPTLLWCSSGPHYVDVGLFGAFSTCQNCRARRAGQRARAAAAAQNQQMQVQLEQQEQPPLQQPEQPNVPVFQNQAADPLNDLAISAEDRVLLQKVRTELMAIQLDECSHCNEKWFDMKMKNGKCSKCAKTNKWTAENNMDPGLAPNLPVLTEMEEILISPVHAMTQVWQIHGGQYAYRGHVCNFPRDTAVFHNRVPLLPEECEVIVFRRTTATGDEVVNENFRVRKAVLVQWLDFLEANHPSFQNRRVTVDRERLNSFDEDANVAGRIQTIAVENLEARAEEGPPEDHSADGQNQAAGEQTFSAGFAPNLRSGLTEFEQLAAAAQGNDPPEIVLTMPMVRGTPINEHSAELIAINAFPTLFPTGKGDFKEIRGKKVTMEEWAAHLMRYNDGRFARHSRFRYWALNTIFRKRAKNASKYYAKSHPTDGDLSVEDIREMIDSNDAERLAQRVSRSAAPIEGSRPFWASKRKDLTAQIRDIGCPSVFFTCSAADVQWPDLHQHMPGYNIAHVNDADSYKARWKSLNENPGNYIIFNT